MNKILNDYIDNMFNNIEENQEIKEIKNDLKISTNDKYNDLLSQGIAQNDAIVRIMSDFGTVDEIINELKITSAKENKKTVNSSKKVINTVLDRVAALIFILATIVYLLSGFIWGLWGTMWLVYPIAGLIVAAINVFRKEV